MDAVEFILLVKKLKALHVPGDVTSRHDLQVFHRGNQPAFLFVEIAGIGKR